MRSKMRNGWMYGCMDGWMQQNEENDIHDRITTEVVRRIKEDRRQMVRMNGMGE